MITKKFNDNIYFLVHAVIKTHTDTATKSGIQIHF